LDNLQDNLTTKIAFKDIAQSPWAYALYVIVIVLGGVIGGQRYDAATARKDCATEIDSLQKQVKAERSEKDAFFKAYFVERSANQQIQKTVDSTAINNFKKHGK